MRTKAKIKQKIKELKDKDNTFKERWKDSPQTLAEKPFTDMIETLEWVMGPSYKTGEMEE